MGFDAGFARPDSELGWVGQNRDPVSRWDECCVPIGDRLSVRWPCGNKDLARESDEVFTSTKDSLLVSKYYRENQQRSGKGHQARQILGFESDVENGGPSRVKSRFRASLLGGRTGE